MITKENKEDETELGDVKATTEADNTEECSSSTSTANTMSRVRQSTPNKWFFSIVLHVFIWLFVAGIIYLAVPGSSLYSWHPTLMTIGVTGIMYEGMLLFDARHSPGGVNEMFKRAFVVKIHWIMQGICFGCVAIGYIVIYVNKEINSDKPLHLWSWHGWTGLATSVLVASQCLGGIALMYRLIPLRPATMKAGHAMAGIVTGVVGCVATFLGLYTKWFNKHVHGLMWWVFAAPLVLYLVMVAILGARVFRQRVLVR